MDYYKKILAHQRGASRAAPTGMTINLYKILRKSSTFFVCSYPVFDYKEPQERGSSRIVGDLLKGRVLMQIDDFMIQQ